MQLVADTSAVALSIIRFHVKAVINNSLFVVVSRLVDFSRVLCQN